MCGIVGIASVSGAPERAWLAVAQNALAHRGPDDVGEWWSENGQVGFAHRRLAIIDLSPGGHQPMRRDGAAVTIVYNGEIYNFRELRVELEALGYRFRSASDTEVLLAAYEEWGQDCLSHVNGMFAFALHDADKQMLLLARDRAGEKPLYLHRSGGMLYFASELKALMAIPGLPRRIDPVALDSYLTRGYVPGERCILADYMKLPPAHAMRFDLRDGSVRTWRYWDLPDFSMDDQVDEPALLDELETLLEDAVGRQMVADVPLGILLSGGVDSSLITAMAVRRASHVKTFTIGFPGHGSLDETGHARLIADHFGTDHTELVAEATTADLLPLLARQFDEPIIDSSMLPTFLVSRLVHQHCNVALGGDGGDELFGGYGHYSRLLWMQQRLGGIAAPLRQAISATAERILPVGVRGRNWLQGLGVNLKSGVPLIASYFDGITRRRLLGHHSGWAEAIGSPIAVAASGDADILQRATRMDFTNYLAEDILVKVDRASMLNSLELRAPLLDFRLIEFAFGRVPSRLKATRHDKKILLKRLAEKVLPPEFDRQRKQGFSIPMTSWLQAGPFRKLFHEVLLDDSSVFDRATVSSLIAGQEKGRSNGERLFGLVLFELWRREYGTAL